MYPLEFIINLSLLWSEILNRIGASSFIRGLRRYYCNQEEWLNRMIHRGLAVEFYVLGSRAEGTTTEGMESDRDVLECYTDIQLIQSVDDATGDAFTFYGYIFDDENTHPGYVKLHLFAHDMPLQLEHLEYLYSPASMSFYKNIVVEKEKLLLRNKYGRMKHSCDETNGPARTDIISTSKYHTTLDRIFALKCQTWPKQANGWFLKAARRHWPTAQVQQLLRTFGCFITPVGHIDSECKTVEWRLSLSEAERLLIWSLNETQFKCIVLMKLLTKQFIKTTFPDSITSYHCKNVVFSVIESTEESLWQPKNIVNCIHMCLLRLLHFVERVNIPQYFIPENNLLKHKLSRNDCLKVAEIIRSMIKNKDYKFLLSVEIDNIGNMLYNCLTGTGFTMVRSKQKKIRNLCCSLPLPIIGQFSYWRLKILCEKMTDQNRTNQQETTICVIKNHFKLVSQLQKSVIEFRHLRSNNAANLMDIMTSHVCTSLGHHLLSFGIERNITETEQQKLLFQMGFQYISEGLQHDRISNGLKCSYILYRCGLFKEALCRLKVIEEKLADPNKRSTIPVCKCRDGTQELTVDDIRILSAHSLDTLLENVITHCVVYLRSEMAMTPKALVYEMFRSTGHEDEQVDTQDFWMRHVVVDPVIMLFYIQFLCYRELGDVYNQEKALLCLVGAIVSDQNLGHLETGLNILGHCFMEQGFYGTAFLCFVRSLNYSLQNNLDKYPVSEARFHVKRLFEHNAAKWHLCVCVLHIIQQF